VLDHQAVLRAHGYHPLRVKQVIQETPDARTFVLEVPDDLTDRFIYSPGQFCTFRVRIAGEEHLRSYSMSSAPDTDADPAVTVKRVPGGVVSNWFVDQVTEGTVLDVTRPAGVFCPGNSETPVVAFCGGSGVTPVMSITKSVLASSARSVKLVYANRDRGSVIFARALEEIGASNPGRLRVHHHLDSDGGFLDRDDVARLAAPELDADFYICGPGPFMAMIESTLLDLGVDPERIFIERFNLDEPPTPPTVDVERNADATENVTIVLQGRPTTVSYRSGDTVLETARRAGLQPPFSCEAGNCATCMAFLREGTVAMRANNALTPEELEEGWVLTCQSLPTSRSLVVEYESV
jgi:3-ketosteroid 9alpha-monooxygenase subunit B